MAHEVFDRNEEVKGSSERSFGLVMATFFLLVTLLPLLHKPLSYDSVRWWALALSAVFASLAFLWTAPLAPLNKLWTKFGLLLHLIVSPIILGLLYYVSVVPIALLMRAFGKDPLSLRRDANASSYWIERTPPGPAPDTMKNQF